MHHLAATFKDECDNIEALVHNIVERAVQYAINRQSSFYIFPSGVTGFGSSIVGLRIPGTSGSAPGSTAKNKLSGSMRDMNARGISY